MRAYARIRCNRTHWKSTDWDKVFTRHKIGHFGDVLPSQSLGVVLTDSILKAITTFTLYSRLRAYSVNAVNSFNQNGPSRAADSATVMRKPTVDASDLFHVKKWVCRVGMPRMWREVSQKCTYGNGTSDSARRQQECWTGMTTLTKDRLYTWKYVQLCSEHSRENLAYVCDTVCTEDHECESAPWSGSSPRPISAECVTIIRAMLYRSSPAECNSEPYGTAMHAHEKQCTGSRTRQRRKKHARWNVRVSKLLLSLFIHRPDWLSETVRSRWLGMERNPRRSQMYENIGPFTQRCVDYYGRPA